MLSGDHGGYIKYWQSNMNNVKMFQAHKEAVRSVSFAPTDQVRILPSSHQKSQQLFISLVGSLKTSQDAAI